MAESSRGPSGQAGAEPDEIVVVDVAMAMRDNAKRLGFDFDPDSDSDSDLVSPVSDFTEEDYNAARAECRELGLQGGPADYYIERIAMPRKALAVREKRVAQRERRISRHHPKVEAQDWYKYQTEYATKTTGGPALEPASLRRDDFPGVSEDLADRQIAIVKESQQLERREWEAGKYEYIVFNSKRDPTYFLRQHDKLLTAKGKLEQKLTAASTVREEALAAVKELPVVQKQLEKAHANMKSLDDKVAYENRRARHLEDQMQELRRKDEEMQHKIRLYQDRETELQDILRKERHMLEEEITHLESRLYQLEDEMPLKEKHIEALELQAKKDLETIKELTDYADETGKSLEATQKAEAESRERAQFYNDIYDASNEAASFHASEAEKAKDEAKKLAEDRTWLLDERYENAKSQIGKLDDQLAEALQKFKDAEEEVKQVKVELLGKEEELAKVNHELDLVYGQERRVSISTNATGSARGYTNLQDDLDEAGSDQFSEPSQSPTLSSLRARVTELEAEVESKSTEVGDHKTKLEAKEAEVAKAYKELKEKATEINNLAHTVKELTEDNEQLRASAEKGRKEHAAKSSQDEDKYAKLYYIHDSLKKDCFDACQKISLLTERLEDKAALIKKQLADSHCALLEAARDSTEKTQELARLTQELATAKTNNSRNYENLSRDFHSLKDQFKRLNKENQTNISKITKLEADLTSRNTSMHAQMASQQEDYEAMQQMHDKMKEALNAANNENDVLKADRARLDGDVKTLTADINGIQNHRDRLAQSLDDLTQEVDSLKDERDRVTKELQDLRSANDRHELWKADNGDAPRKLLEKGTELVETEKQLTEAQMNNVAKQTEINELRADVDTRKAAMQALEEQLENAKKQAAELGSSIADLEGQLAAARHEAAKTSFKIAERDERIAKLEELLETSNSDADGMESEITQLQEQLEALRLSDAEKDDEALAAQEKLKEANNAAAAMEATVALLEEQLDAATARATELESSIAQLQEQLDAATARVTELESSIAQLQQQLEATKDTARNEKSKVEDDLANSKNRVAMLESEIAHLQGQLEATKETATEEKSKAEDDLAKSQNHAAELESSIAKLQDQIDASKHLAEDDLAKHDDRITRLTSKISYLEEQLEAAKNAAKDEESKAENDLAKSKNRVAELEAKIAELEEKLQAAEQKRSRLEDELTKSNDRAAELESQTTGLEGQLKQQDESIRNHRAEVDEVAEIAAKTTDDLRKRLEKTDRKLQVARRWCFLHEERADAADCDLFMAEEKHAKDLAEKQAEIDELSGKIDKMHDEIAKLEQNQMDPDYDLAKFVDTMESGLDDLERAKDQAEEAVVTRDEQIRELEVELETTKQIATDMGLQLYNMENEIKNLRKSRDKHDAVCSEKLDLMTNIRTRLQQLLKKANDCQASVEQKVGNLNTRLQASRDSAAQAEQELDALKDKLKDYGAKLLAEEVKSARQAGEIVELEEGRAKDCEANLAKVQQLEVDLGELQDEVSKRAAKEKELEDLVKSKEEEVKTLQAEKQQSDEQSQRILELQKSLADITDQQTQNDQASVVAAQELQTKLDETKAINDQLFKDLIALTHKAATWDVKEKDFRDLVQLQVQTVKSLQDQLNQTIIQYRAILRRSMGDAAIIQNLRAETSRLWSDLVDATRENAELRQKLKDLEGQKKTESLCHTCGRGCKCPIALPEVSGFFGQWSLVFMAIWAFLEMMPKNTKIALVYLWGILALPARCWKPLASRAKFWKRKRSSKGKIRAAGAPGDPDWDWPTLPTLPHGPMVYSLIFWAVVLAILISCISYWATSVERALWLGANTDTRAYFNFGRREGAPGACLVPQPLPVDYRFVYEPTYGNFCDFVERRIGYALC
ncbi:uncharacterized protein PpBr36_09476 [Pyricularia pennisetigena]|uniref:uncharacterized protein n=1 Tax=Pyricularia pennisetigena TaxID=1578925 RepID=UPI0011524F8E|nr:uncharacterized protein PpBr36_09476 [Pyricularia pennisetigena]TLS21696.1 hypothetical protein PpBr36_09476 [Pyricularia pennisetigena]